jgi:hypothetical protein
MPQEISERLSYGGKFQTYTKSDIDALSKVMKWEKSKTSFYLLNSWGSVGFVIKKVL